MQKVDSEVGGDTTFGRVRVVEQLGPKLNNSLSNTAPWRKTPCGRQECLPCKSLPGSCKARNITYSVTCNRCRAVYWGESHRTWYDRSQDHARDIRTGAETNAMVKHQQNHHPNETPEFSYKLDRAWKTSLQRQIREGIKIQEEDQNLLMNSKGEWGHNGIPRIIILDDKPQKRDDQNQPPDPDSGTRTRKLESPDGDQQQTKRKRTTEP